MLKYFVLTSDSCYNGTQTGDVIIGIYRRKSTARSVLRKFVEKEYYHNNIIYNNYIIVSASTDKFKAKDAVNNKNDYICFSVHEEKQRRKL